MPKPDPPLLKPGRIIGGAYTVDHHLGSGWQGEVYRVTERRTGALRAAKVFYPERNPRDRAMRHYAKKLERLRDCRVILQYHHSEDVTIRSEVHSVLISELVKGQPLPKLVARCPGKRFQPYEALSLLRHLADGLAEVHERGEYHGDLHAANILIRRRGVGFDTKLIDFYDLGRASAYNIRTDVVDLVRVFYDTIGGQRWYHAMPKEVKHICAGLKRSIIEKRFPTARKLCQHLDTFEWHDPTLATH